MHIMDRDIGRPTFRTFKIYSLKLQNSHLFIVDC